MPKLAHETQTTPASQRTVEATPIENANPEAVNLENPTAADMLSLQRMIGNRALNRMIQRKLTVGAANDPLEAEADAVANRVMSGAEPVQRAGAEEEEEIAMAKRDLQRAKDEEEEEPSPKRQKISRAEEEEPLQVKRAVQRVEDEEEVLTKRTMQRQDEQTDMMGSFDAGPTVESRIQARTGSGSPLPGETRNFMEDRIGADFSNVRVHTDSEAAQISRDISAQAFTYGSDIYFDSGKYDPGSDSGKHLLAHELTHTVQQGAAPTGNAQAKRSAARKSQQRVKRKIQRAVGYEFETNFKIEKKKPAVPNQPDTYAPMAKAEVVTAYPEGFRMEADENSTLGSTIEFVVDPPVQESEPDKLQGILGKLNEVSGQVDAGKAAPNVAIGLDQLTNQQAHANYRVTPKANGLTANPQVTGGIGFDRIVTLLQEIGKASNKPQGNAQPNAQPNVQQNAQANQQDVDAPLELNQMGSQFNVKAAERGIKGGGSNELKGLIALLTSYIRFGQKSMGRPLNYAKLISNYALVRTDFATMFNMLPEIERNTFKKFPDMFVEFVLDLADLGGQQSTLVFERGIFKTNDPNKRTANDVYYIPVTRELWLKGITAGIDWLSSKHIPEMKNMLEGLGALGDRTDQVGDDPNPQDPNQHQKGTGIVMEFRNMRKDVPWAKWGPMATAIFNYIVELNARNIN